MVQLYDYLGGGEFSARMKEATDLIVRLETIDNDERNAHEKRSGRSRFRAFGRMKAALTDVDRRIAEIMDNDQEEDEDERERLSRLLVRPRRGRRSCRPRFPGVVGGANVVALDHVREVHGRAFDGRAGPKYAMPACRVERWLRAVSCRGWTRGPEGRKEVKKMRRVDRFIRKYGEGPEGRALYRRLQQLAAQGCALREAARKLGLP